MKALRKGIIFTICLMLVFSLVGQKEKRQELTLDRMRMEISRQGLTFTVGKTSVSDVPLENLCRRGQVLLYNNVAAQDLTPVSKT